MMYKCNQNSELNIIFTHLKWTYLIVNFQTLPVTVMALHDHRFDDRLFIAFC